MQQHMVRCADCFNYRDSDHRHQHAYCYIAVMYDFKEAQGPLDKDKLINCDLFSRR